jgi:hypothetical protein
VTSISGVSASANSSRVPIAGLVEMQREYLASPRVSYSWDAPARHKPGGMSADQVHRAVSRISGVHEDVTNGGLDRTVLTSQTRYREIRW